MAKDDKKEMVMEFSVNGERIKTMAKAWGHSMAMADSGIRPVTVAFTGLVRAS